MYRACVVVKDKGDHSFDSRVGIFPICGHWNDRLFRMIFPCVYLCSDDGEQDEERNELRENCFAAFESVVLRCPREVYHPQRPLFHRQIGHIQTSL